MWLQAGSGFVGRGATAAPVSLAEANFNAENMTALTDFGANWVNNFGYFVIVENLLYSAASDQISVAHRSESVSNNQYAEAVVGDAGAAGAIGVAVRCGSGTTATAYCFYAEESIRYLFKYVDGVFTLLDSEVAATAIGGELALSVSGTTLTPYYNDVVWSKGAIVDTSIASGHVGIVGRNDAGDTYMAISSWAGGDL